MRYCEECGVEIEEGCSFCTSCGTKQEEWQEDTIYKFCEECGTAIEEGNYFCSECGQVLENYRNLTDNFGVLSSHIISEIPTAENSPKPLKLGSKKQPLGKREIRFIAVAAVAVFAVAASLFSYFSFFHEDTDSVPSAVSQPLESSTTIQSSESSATIQSSESSTIAETTPTTAETVINSSEETDIPPEPTIDFGQYIGYWHKTGGGSAAELAIFSIDGNKVEFMLDNIQSVFLAELKGNIASFSLGTEKGTLTFNASSISVDYSYGYSFLFDVRDDWSFYDPTNGPPNVQCPSCGYEWFTTGVGAEGFICANCGRNFFPQDINGGDTPSPEPTQPAPTEPEPVLPQPTEPKPTQPQPTEPEPTEPEPNYAKLPSVPVTLEIKNINSSKQGGYIEITDLEWDRFYLNFSIKNVNEKTISSLKLEYWLYDDHGEWIGSGFILLSDIPSGATAKESKHIWDWDKAAELVFDIEASYISFYN